MAASSSSGGIPGGGSPAGLEPPPAGPQHGAIDSSRPATLLPDDDWVYLSQNAFTKQWVFGHLLTGEVADLTSGEGVEWELHVDADDIWLACYDDKGLVETKDASDLLKKSVYMEDMTKKHFIVYKDDDGWLVQVDHELHRADYEGITIGVRMGQRASALAYVDAALFEVPREGVQVFWNLLALHDAMGLRHESRTAGKWVVDGISGWENYVKGCLGRPNHVLRSKQYGPKILPDGPGAERTLPFPSCSSVALIALLTRFSYGAWKLKGVGRPEKAQELLRALLKEISEDNELRLFVDDCVQMHGQRPWEGSRPVALPVHEGEVDLQPILDMQLGAGVEAGWIEVLREHCGRFVSMQLLLGLLMTHLSTATGPSKFAVQALLNVGELLDARVRELLLSGEQAGSLTVDQIVRGEDQRSNWQLDSLLDQYQAKVRQQTANALFLSVGGPGGSRVGTKKMHLSVGSVPGGLAWHFPPQVEPDYMDEHDLAEICEDAEPEQVTERQKARQENWLKRKAESTPNDWRDGKRRKRVASYCWMRLLDNAIEWASGTGLKQFQYLQPVAERGCPFTWRQLHLAPDQGSDGVCATNMMRGPLRLNCVLFWDLSHGVHNDVEMAFHNSNLWLFMMVFVVVSNVPCAPWNENKRWQQAKTCMESFYRHVNPKDCPIFMSMLAPLMGEFQKGAELLSADEPEKELWKHVHMSSPWRWKDEKLQVSRFMGMVQRARDENGKAYSRLLAYSMACLELDFLHGKNFERIYLRGETTQPETAGQSTSTARLAAEEKALRSGCQNTMVLACMFWSEPANHIRLRIVEVATTSTLAWHKTQNSTLRDPKETAGFLAKQVAGDFLKALAEVFQAMRREDDLMFCKLAMPSKEVGWEHPYGELGVLEENGHASTLGHLCLSLVGARLKRMAFLIRGWPGQSCGFLGAGSQPLRCAEELKADLAAWRHCKEWEGEYKALDKMVGRSCFNEVAVEQLVACFEQEGEPRAEKFVKWLTMQWQTIVGSQVVEDCFQRCSRMMRSGSNLRAREKRIFVQLIESTVLEGSHNYQAVQTSAKGCHVRRPDLDPEVFHPKMRKPSIPEMRKLIGYEESPKWHSPGPHGLPQQYTDLEVMRVVKEGRLSPRELQDLWLSSLMRHQHNLLIRRCIDGVMLGSWCFAILDVADSVALVWPAREIKMGSHTFYEPEAEVKSYSDCIFIVSNLRDIKAMTYEWKAPSGVKGLVPEANADDLSWRCLAWVGEPADDFAKVACRCAWWALSLANIQKIARYLGKPTPKDTKLFGSVFMLVQNVLGCSDDEALEICTKRFQRLDLGVGDSMDLLLSMDDVPMVVDQNDAQKVQQEQERSRNHRSEYTAYVAEWKDKRKTVRLTAAALVNSKAKAKAKAAAKSRGERIYPEYYPKGEVTQSQLRDLCPPGGYIWTDHRLGGFQCHLKGSGFPRISRLWHLHGGSRAAGLLCIRYLWECDCNFHGLPQDAIPVKDLQTCPLVAGPAAGSASASSSSACRG